MTGLSCPGPCVNHPLSSAGSFRVSFVPRRGAVSTPHPLHLAGGIRGGNLTWAPPPQESLCQPHHILEEEGAPGRGLPHIAAVLHALLEEP